MNAPVAVDLLSQAVERVRRMLVDPTRPTKERVGIIWAAAKGARDLGASDVVRSEFLKLAVDSGLIDGGGRWTGADVRDSVRRFGKADVSHVIAWALRGRNPFEGGPLT